MFSKQVYPEHPGERYQLILRQWNELFNPHCDIIANAANLCALLFHALETINWVGIYRLQNEALFLGPFQGLPACIMLPHGKGVCFSAVESRKIVRVDDVHLFPGHIACDSASRSELVVPIYKESQVYGVLDIDSPVSARFSDIDEQSLQNMIALLEKCL